MHGKILIIDDEEKLRKLLCRIISLEGFKVRWLRIVVLPEVSIRSHAFNSISLIISSAALTIFGSLALEGK